MTSLTPGTPTACGHASARVDVRWVQQSVSGSEVWSTCVLCGQNVRLAGNRWIAGSPAGVYGSLPAPAHSASSGAAARALSSQSLVRQLELLWHQALTYRGRLARVRRSARFGLGAVGTFVILVVFGATLSAAGYGDRPTDRGMQRLAATETSGATSVPPVPSPSPTTANAVPAATSTAAPSPPTAEQQRVMCRLAFVQWNADYEASLNQGMPNWDKASNWNWHDCRRRSKTGQFRR
jgi:hypothetical protein